MTLPDERYRAVMHTRIFLHELLNPEKTPRVPKDVREHAHWLLRHYPNERELEQAAEGSPHIFQKEMEPLTRLVMQYDQEQKEQNASNN